MPALSARRRLAESGAAQKRVEEFVDVVVRRVLDLGYLLDDDRPLAVDLVLREHRLGEDVAQQVERERQVLAQDLGVVAGVLLAGERVPHAAHRVDLLRDGGRGAPLSPEEEGLEGTARCRLWPP